MKNVLKDYFTKNEINLLKKSLKSRIDVQYYVDRILKDKQKKEIIKNAPEFYFKCKEISLKLNQKTINDMRDKLKSQL